MPIHLRDFDDDSLLVMFISALKEVSKDLYSGNKAVTAPWIAVLNFYCTFVSKGALDCVDRLETASILPPNRNTIVKWIKTLISHHIGASNEVPATAYSIPKSYAPKPAPAPDKCWQLWQETVPIAPGRSEATCKNVYNRIVSALLGEFRAKVTGSLHCEGTAAAFIARERTAAVSGAKEEADAPVDAAPAAEAHVTTSIALTAAPSSPC
jgi:hypothetical protein